jgi:hypothetical protein
MGGWRHGRCRFQVSHVLLPRMRSLNLRSAATATACLYHLVAACGGAAAQQARSLMCDAALVSQLLAQLRSSDAQLVSASLAVLDVLSAEPSCSAVLLGEGWMAAVQPLLGCQDGLVRRWAERTLCSLFLATSPPKTKPAAA